jgi:hypothetical protein
VLNGQPNQDVEREESDNVPYHGDGDGLAKCNLKEVPVVTRPSAVVLMRRIPPPLWLGRGFISRDGHSGV